MSRVHRGNSMPARHPRPPLCPHSRKSGVLVSRIKSRMMIAAVDGLYAGQCTRCVDDADTCWPFVSPYLTKLVCWCSDICDNVCGDMYDKWWCMWWCVFVVWTEPNPTSSFLKWNITSDGSAQVFVSAALIKIGVDYSCNRLYFLLKINTKHWDTTRSAITNVT